MSSKKQQIPAIRFKGFTDDWEQRKLSDVLKVSERKNKNEEYSRNDVLSVSREVGTVNQIEYQGRSFAGNDLSNYKIVEEGNIVYTKSPLKGAPYGIFQIVTLQGIISPLYAVYNSTDKAYAPFVALKLSEDTIATKYLAPLVSKGAKNTINVTDKGALEGKIELPSVEEQVIVSEFFKYINYTIKLNQRQLDNYKQLKKSMLQKMFPKDGEKVPDVRFDGFTEEWEQRKLEEDITVVGGATPSKANPAYWNGSIVWLSSQEIKEKYVSEGTYTITKKAVDDNTTKMVKTGTPLIVSRSGILARLFPISIPTKDVAINQDIKALIFDNNKISTNFFVAQIQKNEDFILKSIVKTGTTVQSINMPDFYKLQLFFPLKDEQDKIGHFFQQLDDTIALHQQKVNDYQQLKNVMLQQMFV